MLQDGLEKPQFILFPFSCSCFAPASVLSVVLAPSLLVFKSVRPGWSSLETPACFRFVIGFLSSPQCPRHAAEPLVLSGSQTFTLFHAKSFSVRIEQQQRKRAAHNEAQMNTCIPC